MKKKEEKIMYEEEENTQTQQTQYNEEGPLELRSTAEGERESEKEEDKSPGNTSEEEENCEECEKATEEELIEKDCEECGRGVSKEDRILVLVGMDAVSLFPSMTSKTTARIVREKIEKSEMKMDGFCWKKAMAYIRMNKHLTSKISKNLKKYWPIRKSNKGTEPGMSSEGMKGRAGTEKKQWIFTSRKPTEDEVKEMVGVVAEIGIRVLWDNYCYSFGGSVHKQEDYP